jgi:hypothetical protein
MGHTMNEIEHEAKHPTHIAWTYTAQLRFNELCSEGRKHCQYVPPFASGGLYRKVEVFENEPGYFCLNAFLKDQARAEREASAENQRRGINEDEATRIVASSIRAQVTLARHPQHHGSAA